MNSPAAERATGASEPSYFSRYPTVAFDRDDTGVLTVRLHSNGGPVVYAPQHHEDWCGAFYDIGNDRDNRIVILTGTGDSFIDDWGWDYASRTPSLWDAKAYEGKRMLRNLLDIEVPIIAAVNGPATIHSELAVLSDVTLASTTATFQDRAHIRHGIVPGDGVGLVWLELLGVNRGRYFLLTEQTITAQDALRLGIVNEVLLPEDVMPRARELAALLAVVPPLTLRYSRALMTQRLKRLLEDGLALGLALEGLSLMDVMAESRKLRSQTDQQYSD